MLPRATHEHSFAFSEKEKLVLEVSHIISKFYIITEHAFK